ncbi:MAG: FRG domain-containing protein [Bacilli bacterium]|nr:FRG domain-containing protein [Bacilli bacterium]
MNDKLWNILRLLDEELVKNEHVRKVYNVSYNNKNLYKLINCNDSYQFNFDSLWGSFQKNINYLSEFVQQTSIYSAIDEIIFDLWHELKYYSSDDFFDKDDKEQLILVIKINCMLVVYSVISIKEGTIDDLIELNEDIRELHNKKDNTYYRGHRDYTYSLLPSIYRNLKEYNGKKIDKDELFNIYKNRNIIKKYDDVFGFTEINYDFCSFIQHSISFSPFLDFTEDLKIALSFACNNQ